jgi:EF-P lysine aminoacylase GenX
MNSNKKIINNLLKRAVIIDLVRQFFQNRKYIEIQTPILLSSVVPESYLEYFTTELRDYRGNKKKLYLSASPEASLKKLLSMGLPSCFEITKSFRNIDILSNKHNPEFTMLEWYKIGVTYEYMMDEIEDLIIFIHKNINGNTKKEFRRYQKNKIIISKPFIRYSIIELLEKYANINFNDICVNGENNFATKNIINIATKKGYKVNNENTWEEIFNQIFLNEIEPKIINLDKPVIVYDYPKPMAALAKLKSEDHRIAQRFELYIKNLEIGDCYTELTDWQEQKQRFENEFKLRRKKHLIKISEDSDFIHALRQGIPECSGMAVGLDRLIMFFLDAENIADCIPFPLASVLP